MISVPGTVTRCCLSPVMVSTAQPLEPSTTRRLSSSLRPRMAPPFLSDNKNYSLSKNALCYVTLNLWMLEGILNDDELADEGVEDDDLVVVGVGCSVLVIL